MKPPSTPHGRKKPKLPAFFWVAVHQDGDLSCLFHTEAEMKRIRCEAKCMAKCRERYWRYVKVRITVAK